MSTTDPTPDPVADDQNGPPWAQRLMKKLDELPGKLTATITPEDHDTIAEKVYGFFEKGGALLPPEQREPATPPEDPELEPGGPPPGTDEQPGEKDSPARRLFGRW